MAPKRANPIEIPPAASSGEEDEDETTSSDEKQQEERSSSSEEEEEDDDPKTQSSPLIQKNPPPKDSEESESGSDSESDPEKPIVKPIATKPMADSTVKPSSSKRPRESDQETKRPNKKAGEEGSNSVLKKPGDDAKKQLFQRLFSEDDEIALLKGMLDYSAKKGADPCADMNAFYDFVKKSIHTDVSKAQLMDKVRRLKKKFENNAGKGKKGEDRTFSKAHEHNAFELSKKIWGKEGISGKFESSAAKSNGKVKGINKAATTVIALKAEITSPNKKTDGVLQPMEVDNKSSSSLFETRFGVASMEEVVLKHGLDVIDGEKKRALEAKWRNFQICELELFVERGELINDLAKSMLESYKSKDK